MKGAHNEIKDFQCKQCDYSSSHKYHLIQHIKGVHNKIRDFQHKQRNYASSIKQNRITDIKSRMIRIFILNTKP